MRFDIITIFPDLIHSYASESIVGRAQKENIITVRTHNPRDYAENKWGHVDAPPYGGGPGMVLQVAPLYKTLEHLKLVKNNKKTNRAKTKVVIMDPGGKKFDEGLAEKFSKLDNLVIISGRYEGFDARVYRYVDERISIGDYVLAGGELPALVVTEAVARLIPGVLGNAQSSHEESHNSKNQKEYPQYTRPENFLGLKVPKILLSGDHASIKKWRQENSA